MTPVPATSVPATSTRVDVVPWDDPDARALRDAQQAELRERYGEDDIGHDMTGETVVAMLVLRVDGGAVASGALRDASAELGAGTGELKRMYVRPAWRGRGLSRRVLTELETAARAHGFRRLVLETGVLQPEAIGLYLAAGYAPVPRYGEYADAPDSRCFAKDLDAPDGRGTSPPPPVDVTIDAVGWTDPDAVALRRAMVVELASRYPLPADADGPDDAALAPSAARAGADVLGTFVARAAGRAVGCVAVRPAPVPWPSGWAEPKRLYVVPELRGRGIGGRLLTAAEDVARRHGCTTSVLDTGILPPTSIRLYLRLGYRPVRPAVDWAATPDLLWFARPL